MQLADELRKIVVNGDADGKGKRVRLFYYLF